MSHLRDRSPERRRFVINPRIPLPDAPDTPGISRAAYDAYAPEIGAALLDYKIPLGRMKSVDYITKELVRLRNAHVSGCQICGNFRNPKAVEAGLDETLVAVVDDPDDARFSPSQRAAIRLTEAFLLGPFLDDALKKELSTHFSPEQLVEIALSLVSWNANKATVLLGIDYEGDERLTLDLVAIGTDFL
jgi:AhpD family alkylhydroperoxidase